jgi:hypothetical protein
VDEEIRRKSQFSTYNDFDRKSGESLRLNLDLAQGAAMSEQQKQDNPKEFTVRQRSVGVVVLSIVVLLLVGLSFHLTRLAGDLFCCSKWIGGLVLVLAALLWIPVLMFVVPPIRRKFTTGRFLLTREESSAKRLEMWSRIGAGKPFWPQAWLWSLWGMIVAVTAVGGVLLIIAALNVRAKVGAASGLLLVAGVCFLFLPTTMLFKAVRRRLKTGSILPSEEELAVARARCRKPTSLKMRVLTAALWWLIAIVWTDSALGSMHKPFYSSESLITHWLAAVMNWLVAAIWTVQVFRPTKTQCAPGVESEGTQKPPEAL